jgi:hypothetical protein
MYNMMRCYSSHVVSCCLCVVFEFVLVTRRCLSLSLVWRRGLSLSLSLSLSQPTLSLSHSRHTHTPKTTMAEQPTVQVANITAISKKKKVNTWMRRLKKHTATRKHKIHMDPAMMRWLLLTPLVWPYNLPVLYERNWRYKGMNEMNLLSFTYKTNGPQYSHTRGDYHSPHTWPALMVMRQRMTTWYTPNDYKHHLDLYR